MGNGPPYVREVSTPVTASSAEQLTLDLFTPRTFSELLNERGQPEISVHCNRRLRKGWYVKFRRGSSSCDLHVPDCFKNAPEAVKTALLDWATLPRRTRHHDQKRIIREYRSTLEIRIRAYLNEHGVAASPSSKPPTQKWPTCGCRYDLREVFDTLNSSCFDNRLTCFLRWGTGPTKTSYEITRSGPDGTLYHCITIAGVYDHPDVPRFAIEAIMYHEMLHIHVPPIKVRGRNVIHGADFKRLERAFPHYPTWRQWEREKFHQLRADLRRKRKKTLLQRVMDFLPGGQAT